jgi:hypothetical protein
MKRIALLLIVICSVAMNAQIAVRGVVADAFNESPGALCAHGRRLKIPQGRTIRRRLAQRRSVCGMISAGL